METRWLVIWELVSSV